MYPPAKCHFLYTTAIYTEINEIRRKLVNSPIKQGGFYSRQIDLTLNMM